MQETNALMMRSVQKKFGITTNDLSLEEIKFSYSENSHFQFVKDQEENL